MLPELWGPALWESLHLIAAGYPERPTQNDKTKYKQYFKYVGYILPCKQCAKSYRTYWTTFKIDSFLSSKKALMYWVYLLHNRVNRKLKKEIQIPWKTVCRKYAKLAFAPKNVPKKYCNLKKNKNGKFVLKLTQNKVLTKE